MEVKNAEVDHFSHGLLVVYGFFLACPLTFFPFKDLISSS